MSIYEIHQDSEKENQNLVPLKERTTLAVPLANKKLLSAVSNATTTATATEFQQLTQIRSHFSELTNGKCLQENNKTNQQFTKTQFNTFKVYEDEENEPRKVKTPARKCDEQKSNDVLLSNTPMSVSDVFSPMSIDTSHTTIKLETDDNNDNFVELGSEANKLQNHAYPRHDKDRFFEVVEYQTDILTYFRENEHKNRARPNYMRRQNDINHSMRTILVDWLVEVSEEYKLDTETLYLSVLFIDRFLSHMSVMRNKLQLVGTTAMYIASKYEEIYPPEISDFVFITDDTFNKSQILRMEQIMLKILSFDLCTPSAYAFINMYAVVTGSMSVKVKMLALYISELSLLEADPYLRFLPSMISAGAVALARITSSLVIWTTELETATSYSIENLKEVIMCLSKSHNAAKEYKLQAIQDKYKSEKYARVANITPLEEIDSEKFDEIAQIYYNWKSANMERKSTISDE